MGFSLKSVGNILNDITGASASAKQAQNYALQQMAQSNAYTKEIAQNAHQWEVQDLTKAGLNPILSANGGASASTAATASGATGQSGVNPIDIITTLASARNLIADSDLKEKQGLKTAVEADLMPKQTAQNIIESQARTKYTNERARGYSESESTTESSTHGSSYKGGFHLFGTGTEGGNTLNYGASKSHSKSRSY